jgi:hypothetical protein
MLRNIIKNIISLGKIFIEISLGYTYKFYA